MLKVVMNVLPIVVGVITVVIPIIFCIDDNGQAKKDMYAELFWIVVVGGAGVFLCWVYVGTLTAFMWACTLICVIIAKVMSRVLSALANSQVDYKLLTYKQPEILNELLKSYCRGNAECVQSDSVCKLEAEFVSLVNNPENECRSVSAGDKSRVYILQCSFVPVDKDGNTVVVRRTSRFHMSLASSLKRVFRKKFSLISFSPIPLRYQDSFSTIEDNLERVLACYHREVPVNPQGVEPEVRFLGLIYREVVDPGLSSWEKAINGWMKAIGRYPIYRTEIKTKGRYVFGVYAAHYNKLSFKGDIGIDWKVVNSLFAREGECAVGRDRFFVKDHDEIVDVCNVHELAESVDNDPRWEQVEKRALKLVAGES